VAREATAAEINQAARRGGMLSLGDDGLEKVAAGVTTLDEVIRVSLRAGA